MKNNDDILDNLFSTFEKEDSKDFFKLDGQVDVLFLTGPVVRKDKWSSEIVNVGIRERAYLKEVCRRVGIKSWDVRATYRIPDIDEADITKEETAELRVKLLDSIDENPPKVIIPVSNLALKLIAKKSGIFTKRGKAYKFAGNAEIMVAPSYNLYDVFDEPSLRPLFEQDVDNAYHRFVLDHKSKWKEGYTLISNTSSILSAFKVIFQSPTLAIDLETTGLDFVKDKVTAISMTTSDLQTFVFPMYHFESPLTDVEIDLVTNKLEEVMASPSIEKVLHNCQFDIKFLLRLGIAGFKNISDTKIIHSIINENNPHGLKDILKELFPESLDSF